MVHPRIDSFTAAQRRSGRLLVTAPGPRYFALHKLWLSTLPKRIRQGKAPKEPAQGKTLMKAIREHMPRYPIDGEFIQSLPTVLRQILDAA
jgi:hypothetical protein